MIIPIPTGMKYITRMDYPRTYGWWVRILDSRDGNGKVSRFFRDTKYESKKEGLTEAKKFRDRYFSRLTRAEKTVKHQGKLNKIYSEGVYIGWKTSNGWSRPLMLLQVGVMAASNTTRALVLKNTVIIRHGRWLKKSVKR